MERYVMWSMDGRIVSLFLFFNNLPIGTISYSYARWCPSCQHFRPIWSDFAKAMVSKEIKVAAIDINDYPSLSGRFRIAVLPTIY
jgi:thiol-disulfide isomerase/thioredoxin